jgi:hypothetical protein
MSPHLMATATNSSPCHPPEALTDPTQRRDCDGDPGTGRSGVTNGDGAGLLVLRAECIVAGPGGYTVDSHVKEKEMIVLGLVLLVVGFLLHISILWTLGIILLVIGAVLAIVGGTGRMVGGRAHWY